MGIKTLGNMDNTALKFNPVPYSNIEIEGFVAKFQDKGYAILPKVFERESVKYFKKELEDVMTFNGLTYTIPEDRPHYIAGALALRGRQVLPFVLSHSVAKSMPALHTTIIVIETDKDRGYAPDWHKDREPDGMPGKEYHYPTDVFLAFYFEDVDEDHGPTQIIPGSHRDVNLRPNTDAPVESILLNMEDALLIDQRAWHRGISRIASGTRFVIVYGMYALPHHYGATFQMPKVQLQYWMNAEKLQDRVFFGGPFAPPTPEYLQTIQEEYEKSERLSNTTFPKMS
jgi:hypothetical protein